MIYLIEYDSGRKYKGRGSKEEGIIKKIRDFFKSSLLISVILENPFAPFRIGERFFYWKRRKAARKVRENRRRQRIRPEPLLPAEFSIYGMQTYGDKCPFGAR